MLAKNIFILSLVHVVRLVLPLLLIPLLARTIEPNEFGIYMYSISFSAWLSIFIEYGFNISSTREIAGASSREEIASVISGTQNAKFILIIATLPVLIAAIFFIPVFEGHLYWAFTAWLLGIFMAFFPIYYFQGRENLRLVAITETAFGLVTLISVFFLIRSSDEFYRLPLIILVAKLAGLVILTRKMYQDAGVTRVQLFDFCLGLKTLKSSLNLFIFQGAVNFYTSFNVVFLGFFCSPVQVGAYASAERLMKAGLGFISQFSSAIFPRLNALKETNLKEMEKLRLKVLAGFIFVGTAGMIITWLISPIVVEYMFSGSFAQVNWILGILAILVPAIAISNVLGFQFLLVDRNEKIFNVIIACAAALNVFMAYFFVTRHGAEGMAISWVLIEWMITITLAVVVFLMRRNKASIITG